MFDLKLEVENFLAIKKADLESRSNITVLIAPNRAGKTHLLLLLYTVFWQLWKELKDDKLLSSDNLFLEKLKSVFLWKKPADFISWNAKESKVKIETDFQRLSFNVNNNKLKISEKVIKDKNKAKYILERSPIYIQSAGLGDYYKGIFSMKKYYPSWKIVSNTVADLVSDLFIVADEKEVPSPPNKKYLETFERFFLSKFFINNYRIYIQERGKKYGIEKAASGLKSLSWFYLVLRYNLLGSVFFVDEPEVNLHTEYIDKFAQFIFMLSENRKIFIATHSDYLLESLNKLISKYNVKVDIWKGILTGEGSIFEYEEADKESLIDTTPLNEVYRRIIKELFEYDGEIEL